jgi:death-on-curing protein
LFLPVALRLSVSGYGLRVGGLGLGHSAAYALAARCQRAQASQRRWHEAIVLMHSLVGNHALVDGNKRLALLATAVFLRINGCVLDVTDDEAFALTMSVAAGELDANQAYAPGSTV